MTAQQERLYKNLAIYAGIYLLLVRPILTKVGIVKSKEDRLIDEQTSLPNNINPFSPAFYRTGGPGTKILTSNAANRYAADIYDAMGYLTDDEAKIYGVFRQLKYQSQISFLAEKFANKYSIDLLEYLKRGKNQFNPGSGLNSEELTVIFNIVNRLPKYK